jgi:CRP-like cAMP-binding protein
MHDSQRLLEVVQQNEMLAGLSNRSLRQLLAAGTVRTFALDEALIHQGDPARWFAIVIEGRAKLVQLAKVSDRRKVRHKKRQAVENMRRYGVETTITHKATAYAKFNRSRPIRHIS